LYIETSLAMSTLATWSHVVQSRVFSRPVFFQLERRLRIVPDPPIHQTDAKNVVFLELFCLQWLSVHQALGISLNLSN